jgi:hypothetical protein
MDNKDYKNNKDALVPDDMKESLLQQDEYGEARRGGGPINYSHRESAYGSSSIAGDGTGSLLRPGISASYL